MRARAFDGTTVTFTAEQIRTRDHVAKRGPKLPGVGLAQWTSAGRRAGLFNHRFEDRVLGPTSSSAWTPRSTTSSMS